MFRPLQILLVEDNPINQRVAANLLRKHGHEVAVAENGQEALQMLEGRGFDLVLMDIQMPEMDGLQATAAIRAREQGTDRHVPIVALTAMGMPGDCEMCLNAGMDGYLKKPVEAGLLNKTLDDIMGHHGSVDPG